MRQRFYKAGVWRLVAAVEGTLRVYPLAALSGALAALALCWSLQDFAIQTAALYQTR